MLGDSNHDIGRAEVYAAEAAAFAGTIYETRASFDQLEELVRRVETSNWWPHGHVDIRMARSDARSSTTRWHGEAPGITRLAPPQLTPATMIHELAHLLAGRSAGHGACFRRAYVDLVGFCLGAEEASWLSDQFGLLEIGQRRWPEPGCRGGAIAL